MQDFEKGGSEYHAAVRPRRGGGCGRGLPREARSFYTMDDLECQIFIQIYREKITETIDLSSPSFLYACVTNIIYFNFSLIVDVYKCKKMCIYKHFNNMHTMNIINFKGGVQVNPPEPPLRTGLPTEGGTNCQPKQVHLGYIKSDLFRP